jgi:hypothetical protein
MNALRLVLLPLVAVMACSNACAASLSDADIAQVRAQMETRRLAVLRWEADSPFPSPNCDQPGGAECILGKLNQALALLYLGTEANRIATANSEIAEAVAALPNAPDFNTDTQEGDPGGLGAEHQPFYFMRASLLYHAVKLFGGGGIKSPGTLTPSNQAAIAALFWTWANDQCRLSDTGADHLWVWGSENIDAQRVGTCWQAADLFRGDPRYAARSYQDGSTAAAQYAGWTGFLKSYIRARARWGLIEIFPPGYARYTLGNIYSYDDFADDQELKHLAHEFLDLWWAQWAQGQIGGDFGGARARVYPKQVIDGSPMEGTSWMYFGVGDKREARAPGLAPATVGTYVPSPVIIDIALDTEGRGAYEVSARAPGIVSELTGRGHGRKGTINPGVPAVLLKTYVTPDFVMGSAAVTKLPDIDWTPASTQNHCADVVLAGDPQARIVAYAQPIVSTKSYNALWGMQSKATQILQEAPSSYSKNAGGMGVWFGSPLQKVERDGWVFVTGSAYVAVRPVSGGYRWDTDEPRWLVLNDRSSPIVIQAARKSDYADFAAFQSAILGAALTQSGGKVSFHGLNGAGILTWDESTRSLGDIDGVPVDIGASPQFRSPFMSQAAGSGQIRISKGNRTLTLDL